VRLTPQMKLSRGIFGGRESRGGDRVDNEDGVGDSKGWWRSKWLHVVLGRSASSITCLKIGYVVSMVGEIPTASIRMITKKASLIRAR
jgi:hypothetical protein